MLTYNKNGDNKNGDIFTTRKRCIATTALPEHLTRQKGFQIYMMQTKTQDMGSGSIPKLLAQLAIPAVVAQIVNLLYNIVDRIYIGHMADVGAHALTGVGLFTPILMLINAFAMLAGAGGAPRAAISMGAKDHETAEKIVGNCFAILMRFALVLTIVFYALAPTLLRLFGASAVTLPYALAYARIYILGTVFVMTVLGMNPFITTQGFAKISMLTTVIGAVWILRFLTGKQTLLHLRRANMKLDPQIILPCLSLGISTFVMLSTESLLSISFTSSLARYGGDVAVGAMTIITSVSQLATLPMQGICQGGQPIISFNFGAGNADRVKKAFTAQFTACFTYATLFWAIVMLKPQFFAGIFTSNMELRSYTSWALRIYMAGIFAFGAQIGCQQSFMALGQAKISLLLACLRKIVLLIPLILILPHFLSNQVFSVFLAEPVSDLIAAIVTTSCFMLKFDGILKKGRTK